jgi:hypothetical protein
LRCTIRSADRASRTIQKNIHDSALRLALGGGQALGVSAFVRWLDDRVDLLQALSQSEVAYVSDVGHECTEEEKEGQAMRGIGDSA